MSELRQKLEAVGWKHIGDSKMFPELYEFHKKFAVTDWVEHYEYPYIELATHANLLDGDDDWSNWGDKEEVEAISLNDSKGLSLSGGLNSVDMYYLRQAMIEAYAEMKVNDIPMDNQIERSLKTGKTIHSLLCEEDSDGVD